ncbi:MAG TPA: calcium/proton exchanger [Candidatus Xenobia bacterium]|jgi:Ca2+:H+ antiporter
MTKTSVVDRVLVGLLVFVPLALLLHALHVNPVAVFFLSCVALVPLAAWMGTATEHMAAHVGEGPGALLNFTLGNLAEIILAVFLLQQSQFEVVKASIAGAVMNNLLLLLGLSMLFGGRRREKQTFNPTAASIGSTMLTVACAALILPAIFHALVAGHAEQMQIEDLSDEIAVVLLVAYFCSLHFSLRTHKHLYMGKADEEGEEEAEQPWSVRGCIIVLVLCALGVTVVSEILASSVEVVTNMLGWSKIFVGVVVLSTAGAASEHATAIRMAIADRMDLAVGIGIGSSIQIALFMAPTLVLVSRVMGKPMDLVFNMPEVACVALAVVITGQVANDGESNWMEGVQLICVYVIMALVFFHLP